MFLKGLLWCRSHSITALPWIPSSAGTSSCLTQTSAPPPQKEADDSDCYPISRSAVEGEGAGIWIILWIHKTIPKAI